MDRTELQDVFRKRPFVPIEIGLSDGRAILVRHPDQVMLTRRNAVFGLTQVKNGRKRFRTPDNDDRYVKDWLMVDLLHVVSAEPVNGDDMPKRSRGPRRRQ